MTAIRAAMSPREAAIADMVVLKGRSLDSLAAATKQPRENLERLLVQAGERIADGFAALAETV